MKKDKIFKRLLTIVCGTSLILYFFGAHIAVSLSKGYFVLFRNSNICTRSQSWAGFTEYLLIQEATNRMASKSQLLSVDGTGLQQWQTPFGPMWFPSKSAAWTVHFALAQLEYGAYPDVHIHAGDVVLDCGGYVGDWTKWALQAGASKVIIVEPAADALECIRRNLAEGIRQGRVIIYPKAVWDSEGSLYLSHDVDNPAANAVVNSETPDEEVIEVTTVDKIISDLRINRLDVIKMDIEGAEVRALRGAYNTLNRFRPQLVVATEHTQNWVNNDRDVIRAVSEIAPFYHMRCGCCDPTPGVLTPVTLYFSQ